MTDFLYFSYLTGYTANMKKTLTLVGLAALLCTLSIPTALAATVRAGEEYTLSSQEVVNDNLHVVGRSIFLSGRVRGDVLSAGGKVLSQGVISGDMLLAGGNVDVLGAVGGDVRAIGGEVTIGDRIGGDVVIAGGSVHLLSGSTVSGDVIVTGGRVVLDGVILGGVRVLAGQVVINGLVSGSVSAKVSESLAVNTGASIKGDLVYTAPAEAEVSPGALVSGTISFTQSGKVGKADLEAVIASIAGLFFFVKFLSLLVASLLVVIFLHRIALMVSAGTLERPGRSLLVGFVSTIIIPVSTLILFVTVVGAVVGVALGLLFAVLLVAAKILSAIVAGALLAFWIRKEVRVTVGWTILGAAVLALLSLVPILGWLLSAALSLMVLGFLVERGYGSFFAAR